MDDSNASKEDWHKVDIKLDKQPKVEEQHNVDVKPPDEPPKAVTPKVDFRTEFTAERKFDNRKHMIL
ncbi:hypothetical protein L195_g053119 [Trifolium pratense]|uniref:Uncharacterized protein n=1 Tax=Trifolium pratense TaxID=57577 RepID=A0A2K3K8V7_TRIPR|nr:hypothetical protein L195_g053119 [Trifolium pratense]